MTLTAPREKTDTSTKEVTKQYPLYHVILLNDEFHSYDYVIDMLASIFRIVKEKAFKMAEMVDTQGRVIVATLQKEQAEFKQDQIHSFGPDYRIQECKGAMTCVIEPAE